MSIVFCGCEKQYLADDGYAPETTTIEAKESRKTYFFETGEDFNLSAEILAKIDNLLLKARQIGTDNIGFMLISDKLIPLESQKKAKKQIRLAMNKRGFINSRIVDSGHCIYKGARLGIRIDILKYETKKPDCDIWSEYVGDTDTNKHLPKCGVSDVYNLGEMIANKADLIAPREYAGQDTQASIAAMSGATGGTAATGGGGDTSTMGGI
jgi:type IV pilus biogenesis protein CpaD/CtpE